MSARSRKRGLRKLLGFVGLLAVAALLGGFLAFAHEVDSAPQTLPTEAADGVVVWTGKGGGRLEAAGRLMADGRGERLLVSGVNESLDEAAVAELLGLSDELTACCLDIDYAAQDTRGNAVETARWAEALGYDHVLLVTSAYHMPRARVEIAQARGGLRITPVAVRGSDTPDWYRDAPRARRLLGEYGKYLLSLARGRTDAGEAREPAADLELPEEAAP